MAIDLAYPIKTGRRTCLSWSLRSVQANLDVPVGRLFLFGPIQRGIDAQQVKMHDRAVKAINLQRKYQAMIDSELSDPFLLLDDDHIFLKRTSDLRLRTWGTLPEHIAAHGGGSYGANARNALELLRAHGLPERSYQVHYPMLIHKAPLQRVLRIAGRTPVLMGSLYGNVTPEQPSLEVERDNKLNTDNELGIRGFVYSRPFVSFSDAVERTSEARSLMVRMFPVPSRWELGRAAAAARTRRARHTARRER